MSHITCSVYLLKYFSARYYELAQSRTNLSSQPGYATDSSKPLYITTQNLPAILWPYMSALIANLTDLLKDCGFNVRASAPLTCHFGIAFSIYFPAQLAGRDGPGSGSDVPQTLEIDDEFSRAKNGKGKGTGGVIKSSVFQASAFGRLLMAPPPLGGEDNGTKDNVKRPARKSKANAKRRKTTTARVKSETADEDGTRASTSKGLTGARAAVRARSATRRASTATMSEDGGALRRSKRNVVKEEED